MRVLSLLFPLFLLVYFNTAAQEDVLLTPAAPTEGPDATVYVCDSVVFTDFAATEQGYWLFEPASPRPEEAQVIVFLHGYGGYNPMIYGAWIRHLVRQGNIVIYPRYQKHLFSPRAEEFVPNTVKGILDALQQLQEPGHVRPITETISLVGHSYGGVIASNLAIHYEEYGIPKPGAVMLCSPGSGRLSGGVLDSYEAMPPDVDLLVMVSVNDHVVGEIFGRRVFNEAIHTPTRNLVVQHPDDRGHPAVEAGHNESYALDIAFDNGVRNITAKRALRTAKTDVVDHYGYWKLFDALLACHRAGAHCQVAFGNTELQKSLGLWSNGDPIRSLEVLTPEAIGKPVGNTESAQGN